MKKTISLVLVLALGLTAEVVNADFTFGDVEPLPELINTPGTSSGDFTMTADGLEAYFVSVNRPGGYGGEDIWVCRRQSMEDGWGPAVNLGPPVNTSACDGTSSISADGLELYFSDVGLSGSPYRPGGHGGGDIWVTKRATREDDWDNPVNLGPTINSSSMETYPNISADGLSLYFGSDRPGGSGDKDLWVTRRPTVSDPWGTPVNVGVPPNTSSFEGFPNISADGRVLFFYSNRSGGYGGMDIYVTMRATVFDSWGQAVNLGPMINTPYFDISPSLSADGSTLHFAYNDVTGWVGNYKIYRTTISPVVDFNGDGIVDVHDLLILIEHWGTDEPLCDIGPMPWGDGIIDVKDLEVLMSYWQQEFLPVSLLAYWKLDETEGPFAADSAGQHDGTLHGEPLWRPTAGAVDGALELDGIGDYVSTEFVLNPADGPFSIFAWIKGGAPGQAVLSQTSGVNWLCTDSLEGNLKTELKGTGRNTTELLSQTIITDGNWHRIGLVWDGSYRMLYVDDVAVAEDAQTNLEASENGLYIGTGKAMESGTYWSGLIDDVRIYNRALSP